MTTDNRKYYPSPFKICQTSFSGYEKSHVSKAEAFNKNVLKPYHYHSTSSATNID